MTSFGSIEKQTIWGRKSRPQIYIISRYHRFSHKEKNMKHYNVVAAAIRHNGKILCMQRGKTKFDYTAYKWEFPGGKIEDGETPQEAIKREIMEEMDMEIRVGDSICTVENVYPDFSISLQVFWCDVDSTSFDLKEHNAFKWLAISNMATLDWAEADKKVVECLMAGSK